MSSFGRLPVVFDRGASFVKRKKFEKPVACVKGLESLYDVVNIHTYAVAEGWPTWRRSYPEIVLTF